MSVEAKIPKAKIRCSVHPGQFSSEYAISGEARDGGRFSLFADKRYVEVEGVPSMGVAVPGWLTVSLWDREGDAVIVRLPSESLEAGWWVTVGAGQFRDEVPQLATAGEP
jgi:hypothetical protein